MRHAVVVVTALVWVIGCSGGDEGDSSACLSGTSGDGSRVFERGCRTCHSASRVGIQRLGAPEGVNFDTETDLRRFAERIRVRAIEEGTMPPSSGLMTCDRDAISAYLDGVAEQACVADCGDRVCGHDGCTGSCGDCTGPDVCDLGTGQCVPVLCEAVCEGRACGDDGCGNSCGTCAGGLSCDSSGDCVCAPACDGRECGDDGCGGTCGACGARGVCGTDGLCQCTPSCSGRECGDNGCGGSCGMCMAPDTCAASGVCECVPSCGNKLCGDDGCGGTCGMCSGVLLCNTVLGTCGATCTGDCTGRECGSDGCGGSCGPCSNGESCNTSGQCVCVPDCVGRACGADGCGGSCGPCAAGSVCDLQGQCMCQADCTGRECGNDGCGGSCGDCGVGEACDQTGQCQCMPSCPAGYCGDNGCGGSCGACATGQQCVSSVCEWPDASFINDVWPALMANGCSSSMCHGGMAPKASLNMSSAQIAYTSLVNVGSEQCSNKKRVAPGDPAASYLINKITGVGLCFGTRMPKMGTPLSATAIDRIRAWIGGGALNN